MGDAFLGCIDQGVNVATILTAQIHQQPFYPADIIRYLRTELVDDIN